MKDLAGFSPQAVALIMGVSVAYFVICWAPVIWPLIATHKLRRTFPRRWLFVASIFSLTYGVIAAFLTLLTLPVTAYGVFIAPQLSASGFHLTDPLLRANSFIADYWWLLLAPALLIITYLFIRKLLPAWPAICQALTANNSFKPNPLRGSA